jgi:2,3-bisphosphoglycerate-dependent phosphoglycerate mutase
MAQRRGRIPGVFDEAFLTDVEGVTELIFVRHAQQSLDFDAVVGEAIDPPLTERGQAQARLVGGALSTTRLDGVFASPMRRAAETAQAITAHHKNLKIETLEDLREVGVFQDIPHDRTAKDYLGEHLLAGARQRMLEERSWDVYPLSEGSFDFRKRVINAVESIIARNVGERLAVVCHGGVINAYIGHIIKTPYDMFFRPAHTSVSIVAVGGARRVVRLLNDTHHLTTAEGDFATY